MGDFVVVICRDIVVGFHLFAPAGPCLAVAALGALHGDDGGQRVQRRHQAVGTQVALAILRPAHLDLCRIGRVVVEYIPPERDQIHFLFLIHDVIVAVHPGVSAPTLAIVNVAIGPVGVPDDHLEMWVNAVTSLVKLTAQPVGIHIVAQLHHQLVVDKGHHVDVLAIVASGKSGLHRVDSLVDVSDLLLAQVLVVGLLVLEQDVAVGIGLAIPVHRVELGPVCHVVVAVHLHQVVAGDCISLVAGAAQVQAMLALGNDLGKHKHAIVGAVQYQLAMATLRHILHPRARQFEGQHVADQAPVDARCEQGPVVVLAHAQQGHLLLLSAATLQRFGQRAE